MNKIVTALSALSLGLGMTTSAYALPDLQLDADGAVYDNITETSVCSTASCDFYAIATPGQNNPGGGLTEDEILNQQYYVSIAVIDTDGAPAPNSGGSYGSFTYSFDGGATTTTVNVTADMTFGTAPLETVLALAGFDAGDLSQHGIFETYFVQVPIEFVTTQKMDPYNAQDDVGVDPSDQISATGAAFYDVITIDRTNLDGGLNLHLDLYNTTVADCVDVNNPNCVIGDVDAGDFAPFSKDAETSSTGQGSTGIGSTGIGSTGTGSTGTGIPEPSTLTLLGFGLLSGLLYNRRRKSKAV